MLGILRELAAPVFSFLQNKKVCCLFSQDSFHFKHFQGMNLSDCINKYIYLTGTEDYVLNLAKLCERFALKEKRVLLITSRQQGMASCYPWDFSNRSKYLTTLQLLDVESTPHQMLELQDNTEPFAPDLIIFDLQSLVLEALLRPVMQQCSTDKMVRHIAKCSAAFVNYREILANLEPQKAGKSINTIVVMSQEPYPMSPAQFKLLIGLYFHGNECYTNFAKLSARIQDTQGVA
ncbi:uncharacterized protein LOC108098089 [Drosophila ficusphila]|uniref:uncharacterized protein LOC108098089 n=1 Tax=Drosophila ficusphila TaxID=30025 RepID=UPI0007E6D111|nr:uncharacterized protein LOC108098089 [Drosophila ficusphila]